MGQWNSKSNGHLDTPLANGYARNHNPSPTTPRTVPGNRFSPTSNHGRRLPQHHFNLGPAPLTTDRLASHRQPPFPPRHRRGPSIVVETEPSPTSLNEDYTNLPEVSLQCITMNCLGLTAYFKPSSSGRRQDPPWQKSESNTIAFKDISKLYYPGTTVLRRDNGVWRAYKVGRLEENARGNVDNLYVHCYYLDFDRTGQFLVPHPEVFVVRSYTSERLISTFDIIPHWYFDQSSDLLSRVFQLNSPYRDYGQRVHYQAYFGDAWPMVSLDVSGFKISPPAQPSPRCRYLDSLGFDESGRRLCYQQQIPDRHECRGVR